MEVHDRFCPACGAEQPAEAAVARKAAAEQRHFRCQNCGAEVAVDPSQRSYTCAFCDSTYVVEFNPAETGRQPPEFVIGFAFTPEQAQETFRPLAGRQFVVPARRSLRRPRSPRSCAASICRSGRFRCWPRAAGRPRSASIGIAPRPTRRPRTARRSPRPARCKRPSGGRSRASIDNYYSGYLVSGSRGLPHQEAAADPAVPPAGAEALSAATSSPAGWPRNIRSPARRPCESARKSSIAARRRTSRPSCRATPTAIWRSKAASATSTPTCSCCRSTC